MVSAMVRVESLPENEDPFEQVCMAHLLARGDVLQDDVLYSLQLMVLEFALDDWRADFQDDIERAICDLWYWSPRDARVLVYGLNDYGETTLRATVAELQAMSPHEAAAQLTQSMATQMSDPEG